MDAPEWSIIFWRVKMNMSQKNIRVLVIGGGLGGLCLAQGLRKEGVDVAVYERDAGLAVRTQGHRIHIDTRGEQALCQCLPPSLYELFLATRGQPSKGISMFSVVDGQLKEGVTQPFPESGSDEFVTVGSAVDRLTLRQILLAGLDDIVHFNQAFARYEQLEDGRVCAYFTDGTRAIGDVLVAADGVGSRIRQQFLPHAEVLETDVRWLGGKTLLTNEIIRLLPEPMHERFAMVSGLHPEDYLMWGLLGGREQFPIPDEDLQAMDSADLQRTAVELTKDWYPTLSPLTQQADPEESFFLTMRSSVPIEHWQTSTITLLGDAIHVMPANGSGANSALRDASQLSRSLIAVASQGAPPQQALHDYEIEMLRSSFGAVRTSLQGMQRRGLGTPFALNQGERRGDRGN
jgi:2-polyprenyl-6-methoxyphenol hydroxylase-like FAD-dependent oxidoreductase